MKKTVLFIVFCISALVLNAQTKVNGIVYDEYLEPFPGAVVKTSNGSSAVTSKLDGAFTVKVKSLPTTLIISSVGYSKETIEITNSNVNDQINVILKETNTLEQVVISASRTPERVLESPVTIERIGTKAIKNNTSANFYDGLENLKGVDINASSLGFKSINTRGFSPFENVRFVQLIDGMDTAIPSLNFSTGNNVGASEIDVKTVEILPGAASALYGANAFNGILLIKTKSPFEHSGITAKYRTGITSQNSTGNQTFNDASVRMAYKFNEFLAAKAVMSIYRGEEWLADNYNNTNGLGGKVIPGNRDTDINYDGVNVYGDEISANLRTLASFDDKIAPSLLSLIPDTFVSRTGYNEIDLIDNKADMTKFSAALHYRPWGNNKLEIILNSRFGFGNNMYHGQNRYFQKNYSTQQYKLEFLGENFFVRGYYFQDDAGDSYNTRFAGININRQWKSDEDWYRDYIIGYLQTKSHKDAREKANTGRLDPGTPEFERALNKVISDPNVLTGAKFEDESSFVNLDANYNLKNLIDWAEIQVGGSFKSFALKTNGNIFTDADSPIKFDEFGVYMQTQKKLINERLKLTGSIRYDKSKNFDGNYSPRLSLSYAFGDEKRRNLRLSYQTAFRNPTTQEQYIGLFTGATHILGTAADNLDRYVATVENRGSTPTVLTGRSPYSNGVTSESFNSFIATSNPANLVKANYTLVKPEEVSSFELGYRAMLEIKDNILELDINSYYSLYNDLITFRDVIVPNYGKLNGSIPNSQALGAIKKGHFSKFNIRTNSNAEINAYGVGIGLNTSIFKNYDLGFSYNWADYNFDTSTDPNFKPGFNLAKHKVKVQFGNENLFKNFGFNVNARWQDAFLWQSTFLDGIVDARTVIDAQLNYRIPSIKSRFKIGGTNLGGKEYVSAPGTGKIGSIYYISWTIND